MAALRTNLRQLVQSVLAGQVANPQLRANPYRIGRDGRLRVVPGTGGISLNQRVGDRAVGLAGDHVEPGVALHNNDREVGGAVGAANRALMAFACIGNRAHVISGPMTGAVGTVTGKHGGINHVLVDFPDSVLRRLRIGDRIQIRACGQGLRLIDSPGVQCVNLAPALLQRWQVRLQAGVLHVPVTHLIPASIMGSGLGKADNVLGDCDIEISDPRISRHARLDVLRYGDLVALCALNYHFGPSRLEQAVTIGVVVHSDSDVAGHGPGVTPLLIGTTQTIRPVFQPYANLASVLSLRRHLAPTVRAPAWDRFATQVSTGLSLGTLQRITGFSQ